MESLRTADGVELIRVLVQRILQELIESNAAPTSSRSSRTTTLLRLVTAVLFEMHDEWIAFPRRYLPKGSMDQLYPAEHPRRTSAHCMTVGTRHQLKRHGLEEGP